MSVRGSRAFFGSSTRSLGCIAGSAGIGSAGDGFAGAGFAGAGFAGAGSRCCLEPFGCELDFCEAAAATMFMPVRNAVALPMTAKS